MDQRCEFEDGAQAKDMSQMFQLFIEVLSYLPLLHCIDKRCLEVTLYIFIFFVEESYPIFR